MFKSKNIIPATTAHNVIATGTYIKGEIKAEEDLRIDGKVEGNIHCSGKVIVGSDAIVVGNIICANADLMGNIKGNIQVTDTVSLKSDVNFVGEVITAYLDIETGAMFNGTCSMRAKTSEN